MWFKNLQLFRLTRDLDFSAEELSEKLAEHAFVPCGSHEQLRHGWVSPVGGDSESLVHAANGYLMVCEKRQEKVVPAQVVNEELAEQVKVIEARDARSVSKKEQREMKDDVLFSLLPKAFARSRLQYAYINTRDGLVVVNAASAKRAEDMLSHLRETLGSLPVIPIVAKNSALHTMTHWLKDRVNPDGFTLGSECELRDTGEESSVIRCKNQDLYSDEINNHLQAGMVVNRLGLVSPRDIECVVDHQLAIKSIKYGDVIQEKAGETEAETAAEQFDIDFCIMTEELSLLVKDLLVAFGGEEEPVAS